MVEGGQGVVHGLDDLRPQAGPADRRPLAQDGRCVRHLGTQPGGEVGQEHGGILMAGRQRQHHDGARPEPFHPLPYQHRLARAGRGDDQGHPTGWQAVEATLEGRAADHCGDDHGLGEGSRRGHGLMVSARQGPEKGRTAGPKDEISRGDGGPRWSR